MNKLDAQRQKEIQQAEELLFAGPQALGFAKGLFQGHFVADWVMPYPRIPAAQQVELDGALNELTNFWTSISILRKSIETRTYRAVCLMASAESACSA